MKSAWLPAPAVLSAALSLMMLFVFGYSQQARAQTPGEGGQWTLNPALNAYSFNDLLQAREPYDPFSLVPAMLQELEKEIARAGYQILGG